MITELKLDAVRDAGNINDCVFESEGKADGWELLVVCTFDVVVIWRLDVVGICQLEVADVSRLGSADVLASIGPEATDVATAVRIECVFGLAF